MKKSKKILASIMAATVSAVSLCSMFSTSAATKKYNVYAYYFNVPENSYIKTFNVNASYDPNKTMLVGSHVGDLGGNFLVNDISISDNSNITYVNYSNSSPNSNSGCLGCLGFKIISGGPTINITSLKNDRNNNLALSTVQKNLAFMGDVNLDGDVNEKDLDTFQKYLRCAITFNETQLMQADVNFDGIVDDHDATNLMHYLLGNYDSVAG